MIPKYLNCKENNEECLYFIDKDCPETCIYSKRIKKGIHHTSKTGLERFLDKFPNWNKNKEEPNELGIGAIIKVPDELKKKYKA